MGCTVIPMINLPFHLQTDYMNNSSFNKGLGLTALGSFWWGVIGVIYFEHISYIGFIEVVLHRAILTSLFLILTTFFFSKWDIFYKIISNTKNLITLFLVLLIRLSGSMPFHLIKL